MNEGDIVICPVVSASGSTKVRPAVVLRELPTFDDYLICGISSQLWQQIPDFDEVLQPDSHNQLRTTSLVRLSFLATVRKADIRGTMGRISPTLLDTLRQRLADYLITV